MLTNRTHLVKTNKNQHINQKLLTFTNKGIHQTPVQLQPTPPFQKKRSENVCQPRDPQNKNSPTGTDLRLGMSWKPCSPLSSGDCGEDALFWLQPLGRRDFCARRLVGSCPVGGGRFFGRLYFETVQLLRFSCRRRRRRRRRRRCCCCCWTVTMFD